MEYQYDLNYNWEVFPEFSANLLRCRTPAPTGFTQALPIRSALSQDSEHTQSISMKKSIYLPKLSRNQRLFLKIAGEYSLCDVYLGHALILCSTCPYLFQEITPFWDFGEKQNLVVQLSSTQGQPIALLQAALCITL